MRAAISSVFVGLSAMNFFGSARNGSSVMLGHVSTLPPSDGSCAMASNSAANLPWSGLAMKASADSSTCVPASSPFFRPLCTAFTSKVDGMLVALNSASSTSAISACLP